MMRTSFGVVLSAMLFAATLSLASTGAARADTTMRECGQEWKAAKENNTTNGMKWTDFLKQCSAQKKSAAAPAAAPAAASAPPPAPAPIAPAPATYQPKPKPMQAARPTGAGEFASEAEAKGRCPGDTVVWVNTRGKKAGAYHYAGSRWYAKTKQGAYMCEADAGAAGYHASKSKTEQPKQM
jgi:hypothetical protein